MSSVDFSQIFNRVTSDIYTSTLKNYRSDNTAQTYIQTVWQQSDQRSNDDTFSKGIEWHRAYMSLLQSQLNTSVEKLTNTYRAFLEQTMHSKATTMGNTSTMLDIVNNGTYAPTANQTGAHPGGDTTPPTGPAGMFNDVAYTANVRNYVYHDPFFGSKAVDGNTTAVGRTDYGVYKPTKEMKILWTQPADDEIAGPGRNPGGGPYAGIGMWSGHVPEVADDWYFYRRFKIDDLAAITEAKIWVNADDFGEIWVNGQNIGMYPLNSAPQLTANFKNKLVEGENIVVIRAGNTGVSFDNGVYETTASAGPSSVNMELRIDGIPYPDPLFGHPIDTQDEDDYSNWRVTANSGITSVQPQEVYTAARSYWETGSFFDTVKYLWGWDMDRINTEFATTSNSIESQINISAVQPNKLTTPATKAAQVGDRILLTSYLTNSGMKTGDIKYNFSSGYYIDEDRGTALEAIVTKVRELEETGEIIPIEYKIVYKGTDVEPTMEVLKDLKKTTTDLNAPGSWSLFDLNPANDIAMPFPDMPWKSGVYAYDPGLSGGRGGYSTALGARPYDGDASQGWKNSRIDTEKYKVKIWKPFAGWVDISPGDYSPGVWAAANSEDEDDFLGLFTWTEDEMPTRYTTFRQNVHIDGIPLNRTLTSKALSGSLDDDIHIFLRDAQNNTTLLYSDQINGTNNYAGNIDFTKFTSGDNWLEAYATSGVFSGDTNKNENVGKNIFYRYKMRDPYLTMNMAPFNVVSTSGIEEKIRYTMDENGNIYDNFGVSGWSNYGRPVGLAQQANPDKVIDSPRDGTGDDDANLWDYVPAPGLQDWIGVIPLGNTYYYKQNLDPDGDKAGEIRFNPREANVKGDFDQSSYQIANTLYPSITSVNMSYTEQDPLIYNVLNPEGFAKWEKFYEDFQYATFEQTNRGGIPPVTVPTQGGYDITQVNPPYIWHDTNKTQGPWDFTRIFTINDMSTVSTASVLLSADDRANVYVNGEFAGTVTNSNWAQSLDIKPFLIKGENVITFKASNNGSSPAGISGKVLINGSVYTDPSTGTTVDTVNRTDWFMSGVGEKLTINGLKQGMFVELIDENGDVVDMSNPAPVNGTVQLDPKGSVFNGFFRIRNIDGFVYMRTKSYPVILSGDIYQFDTNSYQEEDFIGEESLAPNNDMDASIFVSFINKDQNGQPISDTLINKIKVEVDGEPLIQDYRTMRYSTYKWNGSDSNALPSGENGWEGNFPLGVDVISVGGTIDNNLYSPGYSLPINPPMEYIVLYDQAESGNLGWSITGIDTFGNEAIDTGSNTLLAKWKIDESSSSTDSPSHSWHYSNPANNYLITLEEVALNDAVNSDTGWTETGLWQIHNNTSASSSTSWFYGDKNNGNILIDDVESGDMGWTDEDPWIISDTGFSSSPTHNWRYGRPPVELLNDNVEGANKFTNTGLWNINNVYTNGNGTKTWYYGNAAGPYAGTYQTGPEGAERIDVLLDWTASHDYDMHITEADGTNVGYSQAYVANGTYIRDDTSGGSYTMPGVIDPSLTNYGSWADEWYKVDNPTRDDGGGAVATGNYTVYVDDWTGGGGGSPRVVVIEDAGTAHGQVVLDTGIAGFPGTGVSGKPRATIGTFALGASTRTSGDIITTAPLNLSTMDHGVLTFDYSYLVEPTDPADHDIREVYYSTNGGASWILLKDYNTSNQNWTSESLIIPGGSANTLVKFHFDTIDGKDNDQRGWNVDNIKVMGYPNQAGNSSLIYNVNTDPTLVALELDYTHQYTTNDSNDKRYVDYSQNNNGTWTNLKAYTTTSQAQQTVTIDKDPGTGAPLIAAGSASTQIRFKYDGLGGSFDDSRRWNVDDIKIKAIRTGEGVLERSFDLSDSIYAELKFNHTFKGPAIDSDGNGIVDIYDIKTVEYSYDGTNWNTLKEWDNSTPGSLAWTAEGQLESLKIDGGLFAAIPSDYSNVRVRFHYKVTDELDDNEGPNGIDNAIFDANRNWNVDDIELIKTKVVPAKGNLTSPLFDLSPYKNAEFTFNTDFKTDADSKDKMYVQYSINGGANWTDLETFSASNNWSQKNYTLPGGSNAVKVRFRFESDILGNMGRGWNVDDIKIQGIKDSAGTPPADLDIPVENGEISLRLYMDRDRVLSYNAPVKVTIEYEENGVAKTRVYGAMMDDNGRPNAGGNLELDNGTVGQRTGQAPSNDGVADDYNNYLTIGKGRDGGSFDNPFTKLLKYYIDSADFQDILRHNMFEDIFISSVTQDAYGDMITGKLMLNWDWKKRRVKIFQASFFALYHS